jgi:TRAP-type C4-dicarboxylate transport system substrate-binding protein
MLKARGMQVSEFSPEEMARVVAKLKPVYDKHVPAIGAEAVSVLLDALKKARGG